MYDKLKKFTLFSFAFVVNQSQLHATGMSDKDFEKPDHYQLKQIHQEKLNLNRQKTEVQKLMAQGFPEKRAKEIHAQNQVALFFEKQLITPLVPAWKIVEQIGSTCEVVLNKDNNGLLDEFFVSSDIECLKEKDAPLVFNETRFVTEGEEIHPIKFKRLQEKYSHTSSYFSLLYSRKAEITKPCGKMNLTVSSLSISGLKTTLELYSTLKPRIDRLDVDHMLTTLKSDGTLTLYKVVKNA
ncbi:hypothetical protein [Candidatus Finniella inopinata]|uniref:Uncharacterized protein n=1 Tax=Candidatus Finniella inopinata TaxID=1696036 RepID=A0A4Q7DLD9_9PROT|nr:hypothetical protein [Candidatus Finniella inopinata]RZI47065.1 hypothetical protein EQU50_00310 [Candidatus Finniella inopinata]